MVTFKQYFLESEEMSPKVIKGDVDIAVKSLSEIPEKYKGAIVDGNFRCVGNDFTNLGGAPMKVRGNFICNWNELTTLEGGPIEVGGEFNCWNNKLSNLKGAPTEVGENFDCRKNPLTSLEGAPKFIGGEFKSDQFSDEDYRNFISKRDVIDAAKKKRQENEDPDSLPW